MKVRRVVTAHNDAGKAVFASDGLPSKVVDFKHVPGLSATLLWETNAITAVGGKSEDVTAAVKSWVPAAGGTNAMIVVFPPDSVMSSPNFDFMAAGGEYREKLPGLAEPAV